MPTCLSAYSPACLPACVEQKTEEALVMSREHTSVELLTAACAEINNALTNPFFGVL